MPCCPALFPNISRRVAVKAPLSFNKLIIEMRWLDPVWVPEIFSSRMKISEALNGQCEMNMLKSKATSPEVSSWACKTDINP